MAWREFSEAPRLASIRAGPGTAAGPAVPTRRARRSLPRRGQRRAIAGAIWPTDSRGGEPRGKSGPSPVPSIRAEFAFAARQPPQLVVHAGERVPRSHYKRVFQMDPECYGMVRGGWPSGANWNPARDLRTIVGPARVARFDPLPPQSAPCSLVRDRGPRASQHQHSGKLCTCAPPGQNRTTAANRARLEYVSPVRRRNVGEKCRRQAAITSWAVKA